MTGVNQAAAHAKNLAKQFRGVMEVAEVLEEIGNLEQTRAEAGRRATEAREEAVKATDEREQAVKVLVQTQEDLEIVRDDCDLAIQSSETRAKEIIDNAKIEAGGMMAVAQTEVDILKKRSTAAEEAYNTYMVNIAREETKVQTALDELNAELVILQKKFGIDSSSNVQ